MIFEKLIGNDKIKEELADTIKSNNVSHSYLFAGPDGIGKKLFAKEFAFQHKSDENRNISPAIRFFKLIFPPIKKMNSKYDYAKKCIILYPVAWMHQLLEGIINNE